MSFALGSHPIIHRFLSQFETEKRDAAIQSLVLIGIDYVSNFYSDVSELSNLLRRITRNIEAKTNILDSQPIRIDLESIKSQLSQLNKRFDKRSDSLPSFHEPRNLRAGPLLSSSLEAKSKTQKRKSQEITLKITETQAPKLESTKTNITRHHLDDTQARKALQRNEEENINYKTRSLKENKKRATATASSSKKNKENIDRNMIINNNEKLVTNPNLNLPQKNNFMKETKNVANCPRKSFQKQRKSTFKEPVAHVDYRNVPSKIKSQIDIHKEINRRSKNMMKRTMLSNPSEKNLRNSFENEESKQYYTQMEGQNIYERNSQIPLSEQKNQNTPSHYINYEEQEEQGNYEYQYGNDNNYNKEVGSNNYYEPQENDYQENQPMGEEEEYEDNNNEERNYEMERSAGGGNNKSYNTNYNGVHMNENPYATKFQNESNNQYMEERVSNYGEIQKNRKPYNEGRIANNTGIEYYERMNNNRADGYTSMLDNYDGERNKESYETKFSRKYPTIPNPEAMNNENDYLQYLNKAELVTRDNFSSSRNNIFQKNSSASNLGRFSNKSDKNEIIQSKDTSNLYINSNKAKMTDIANSFLTSPIMRQFSGDNEGLVKGIKSSQQISNQSAELDNANLNKIRAGELTKTAAFDNDNSMYSSNFSVFDPNEELKSFFQKNNFVQSQHNVSSSMRESSDKNEENVFDYSEMFKNNR